MSTRLLLRSAISAFFRFFVFSIFLQATRIITLDKSSCDKNNAMNWLLSDTAGRDSSSYLLD